MRSIHLLPRDEFGQTWTDDVNDDDGHNGCGALDDILRRSMIEMVVKPNSGGCVVLSGRLSEPYTGQSSALWLPPATAPQHHLVGVDPLNLHHPSVVDAARTLAKPIR